MRAKLVALLVVGVVGVAVWAFGPAELGLSAEPSDNLRIVQADPTWLQYLPAKSPDLDLDLSSLTKETQNGEETRRVDLVEKGHSQGVSLCFSISEADLRAACPGAEILGTTTRPIDEPWVGQLGKSSVDLLPLLNARAPTLVEATYIKS